MSNYCDKIQENIDRYNNKISGFYDKQLENLNAEIRRQQAKIDGLKGRIDAGQSRPDRVRRTTGARKESGAE
jgi:peptidoglycan hydrolase CwlO-like protein